MYLYIAAGVCVLLVAWAAFTYVTETRIEQPPYTRIEERNGYEIREYEPYTVAYVYADGEMMEALNEAFSILAGYIFGNNDMRQEIAMTAPVSAERSTYIGMTAPVLAEQQTESRYKVSFVMPRKFSAETLPRPRDPRVMFQDVPRERVAALSFRGFYNEKRIKEKEKLLATKLERDQVVAIGEPRFAGYNSPFAMPLLIHNEIIVLVR